MSSDINELFLHGTYDFNVVVHSKEHRFSGRLNLSPERVYITIAGDLHDDRKWEIGFGDQDELICTKGNNEFILKNLKCTYARHCTLDRNPKIIQSFEIHYEISWVIFSPHRIINKNSFGAIRIFSSTIEKWIGNTRKQEAVLEQFYEKRSEIILSEDDISTEFSLPIQDIGLLGVEYNLSIHHSPPKFSSGIKYPPYLFLIFSHTQKCGLLIEKFENLYNILYVLTGTEPTIEQVVFSLRTSPYSNNKTYFYFPSKKTKRPDPIIFFPLGKNLRFNQLELPEFPIEAFNSYFMLDKKKFSYFQKYKIYKRMDSLEEKFLGYFRLLESLCWKEGTYIDPAVLKAAIKEFKPCLVSKFGEKRNVLTFLKNMNYYNTKKYNTEKYIRDFYDELPNSFTEKLIYNQKDIALICKLRNDITHANEYVEKNMDKKCKFIEVLLLFKIFNSIGVAYEITSKVINRLDGFYLLTAHSGDSGQQ